LFSGTIIGTVDVALVDLRFRHKAIDVDRVATLDRHGVQLIVLNLKVDALLDFVAAPFIVRFDWVARSFVDQLLAKAIAGFLTDLSEGDPLAGRGRRVKRDRARNEGKFEITLPVWTRRGHANSYSTRNGNGL
jgi:hypothetical protein